MGLLSRPRSIVRATLAVVCLGTAGGVGAACTEIAGLEPPRRPADASTEAASTGRAVDPCDDSTLRPPTRTAVTDAGVAEIDLVFSTLTLDSAPKIAADLSCPSSGFDLDGKTTCLDRGSFRDISECPGNPLECAWGPSCTNPRPSKKCDDTGGVDNALGAFVTSLSSVLPLVPRELLDLNYALRTGQANGFIRIGEYNGEADDNRVTVTSFASSGLSSRARAIGDAAAPDAGSLTFAPWDGLSLRVWDLQPTSAAALPQVQEGYVVDHVLVVDGLTLRLPLTPAGIEFTGVRLTAQLRKTTTGWELVRGRLGGRIAAAEVFRATMDLPVNIDGGVRAICELTEPEQLRETFCAYADLAASPGAPCDTLSMGASFTAVPGRIGILRVGPNLTACDAGLLDGSCP